MTSLWVILSMFFYIFISLEIALCRLMALQIYPGSNLYICKLSMPQGIDVIEFTDLERLSYII